MFSELALKAAIASVCGSLARLSIYPFDLVRSKMAAKPDRNIGTYNMMKNTVRKHGVGGLFQGCTGIVLNQMISSGFSLGGYEIMKARTVQLSKDDRPGYSIAADLGAGFTMGGIAKCSTIPRHSPNDPVFKTTTNIGRAVDEYREALKMFKYERKITMKHFYVTRHMIKRYISQMCRYGFLNLAKVVSYDYFKSTIITFCKAKDTLPVHFVSALFCGGFTVLTTAPYYSIRKRYYSAPPGIHNSMISCIFRMYKMDGLKGFYPSFGPDLIRAIVFNVVLWTSYEQMKKLEQNSKRQPQYSHKRIPLHSH